jgi:hypothetical protein
MAKKKQATGKAQAEVVTPTEVTVRFTRHYGSYMSGELAIFSPEQAQALVNGGIAEVCSVLDEDVAESVAQQIEELGGEIGLLVVPEGATEDQVSAAIAAATEEGGN